ncbi:hypothetical protein TNCT_166571 [Trichonephila clavata]|uniref:Uncharacterized protein n=1 Tax=Trichonephila clavata TaxID=2740835 RepID=A0A8X6JA51_TRICU|nr:hypothetical protein TNCT_166571 [Trichonephila clavata]
MLDNVPDGFGDSYDFKRSKNKSEEASQRRSGGRTNKKRDSPQRSQNSEGFKHPNKSFNIMGVVTYYENLKSELPNCFLPLVEAGNTKEAILSAIWSFTGKPLIANT